jgi:hypothetical protein
MTLHIGLLGVIFKASPNLHAFFGLPVIRDVILISLVCTYSIFIFKYNPTVNLDARLEVQRVYPILQHFSISMAQTQRSQDPAELQPNTNPALIKSPSGGRSLLKASGRN